MADFTNRSPFIVTVPRRPTLKRIFAFGRKADAQTYINNLRSQGLEPIVDQSDCWRRFKIEPPCRLNFEPGLMANL